MKIIGKVILVYLFWLAFPSLAKAEWVFIETVPTTWRLENYPGNNVAVYYSSSACPNGRLTLGPNFTVDDKNRFWSLVMAAKVSGKRIGVAYDSTTTDCQLFTFYFIEQ